VLFPTTGRAERAERCLRQLRETTAGHEVEIVAAVDADAETAKRIGELVDKLLYCPEYRGCSRAWNDCLREAEGDPIVFAADDLLFEGDWLGEALEALVLFDEGWGMVGFNDGHWNGNELATHYLMSRRFIVEVLGGVVAWDFYRHSFNDLEVNARAKAAGRYVWAEAAMVRHEHWLFGDREQDPTDTRTLGDHADAQAIYAERAAAGFPNDGIEAVIS
jgi:glycosyltransferase involved in cell wall biosynthesis